MLVLDRCSEKKSVQRLFLHAGVLKKQGLDSLVHLNTEFAVTLP